MPEPHGDLGLTVPTSADYNPGQADVPRAFREYSDRLAEVLRMLLPAGTIFATARIAAPDGYLLCDGSAVSRTTYAELFEAIGTSYGVGDSSTTFNIPDLRGRVPVGVDGSAGRLSANDQLGKSDGEEKHLLTTGEIPSHAHGDTTTYLQPIEPALESAVAGWEASENPYVLTRVNSGTAAAGGGGYHNNMQPYQVVNYVIKT